MLLVGVAAACKQPAPAKPPPPLVRVAVLQTRALEETHEWLATLDGAVNAEIRPRVAGYVRSVDYQEGNVVAPDTLLFTIDNRPFVAAVEKARGDLANAVANLGKSRADVSRYAPLVAEHAIPREQLENARAAVQASAATVTAMRAELRTAELNLQWTEVRSPIGGIAGIARTRVGTLVDSNQVLTVVSTLDPIRASWNPSQQEYLRYADILNHANEPQYAETRWIELVLLDNRVHPYHARRVIVGREINPQTGTILIQAVFPNPGNILRPGLFAKVRVHTARELPMVLVPEIAVQQLQGQARVYVVGADNRVEVRTVHLGRLVDHSFLVDSGLRAGERVITEGMQNVQPGVQVQVQTQPPPAHAPDGGHRDGGA